MKKAVLRKVKREKEILNDPLRKQLTKCISDSQQFPMIQGTLNK